MALKRYAQLALAGLLAAVVLAAPPARPQARHYTVQSWSVREGLPHNMVHAIARDGSGFLWLATWEGAARYNGHSFTLFDNNNVPALRSRGFREAIVDRKGRLLLGSARNGVWHVEQNTWHPVAPEVLENAWVTRLFHDSRNHLWVATEQELIKLGPDDRLQKRYRESDGLGNFWIMDLAEDAEGNIWVATEKGAFRIRHGSGRAERVQVANLPEDILVRTLRQVGKDFYLGNNQGLFRLENGRFIALPPPFNQRIESLLQSRDGALWVQTNSGGLWRKQGRELVHIGEREGLFGDAISPLFQDQEGLIWQGSSMGLNRISEAVVETIDKARGLSGNGARSLLAARDGSLWIGSNQGFDRWQHGRISPVSLPLGGAKMGVVFALAEDAEGIWVGTGRHGLFRLPHRPGGQVLHLGPAEGLPSPHVRSLATDARGRLWIGTGQGLAYRDTDGKLHTFEASTGLEKVLVRSIYPAPDGRLWFGIGDGLSVFDRNGQLQHYNRHTLPAFPADNAFDIHDDGEGSIWIGSDQGLMRLRNGKFHLYGPRHGLPNPSIFRILPDARGDLWLSSNRGIFRVQRSQLDEIDRGLRSQLALDVLDENAGMPSPQANGNNYPAGARDASGRLWFPTAAGVVIVDPERALEKNRQRPPTVIESIHINGQSMPLPEKLEWPATDMHRLVFTFSGLGLRHIGAMRYRYKLEGFDRDWVEAGNNSQAIYTSLPAGDYRFRVEAMPQPADWRKREEVGEATLSVHLLPPFWQRWPFIVGAGVFVLLLLAGIWSLRERQHQRRQRKLTRLVENRTRELREKNHSLELAAEERSLLMHRLERQAMHDELTGLPNRRACREHLAALCAGEVPVRVAMLDMDHFKHINDQYGHDAGDRTLHAFAGLLREHADSANHCARLGGEEFALLLPGMALADAQALCERLRLAAQAQEVQLFDGMRLHYTLSIGLSSAGNDPHQLLREADTALYRAKHLGRNRVCAAETDLQADSSLP